MLMKLGRVESGLAVYLPNEDNRMLDRIPFEERTPGARYRWEMRHVVAPLETEGHAPLWLSHSFLEAAEYREGRLRVREIAFAALYLDVAWLDGNALAQVVRLARSGLPVILKRTPAEPGRARRGDYADMVEMLARLPNVVGSLARARIRPIVEGADLPPFWVRRTDEHLVLFFAHSKARAVRYPMTYGQSLCTERIAKQVFIHSGDHTRKVDLFFEPYQSLIVRVSQEGKVEIVDMHYRPPVPVLST